MKASSTAILSMVALSAATFPAAAGKPAGLLVMDNNWPRAFFFRAAEGMASRRNITYAEWEKHFSRLMGIEGKALDEEIPGRSAPNIRFFSRFKQSHPRQLVLLHYNGNARDPRDSGGAFFAGHWIYHNGAKILSGVPAEDGTTEIRVADASLFRCTVGRYRESNEDVGLCVLGKDGRPDWHRSEQVQLVSTDRKKNTIVVRRGCYGTKPRPFPAGGAYAAAHVHEGPWGKRNNLMWFYNYATCCPKDRAGRTCTDVLVEDLAAHFAAGGDLAAFDGLEFDVLHHTCGGGRGGRRPDVDADGKADGGFIGGRNVYGAGVVAFCRAFRKAMGDDRLILADGFTARHQRAFGLLNGIESEGWPALRDHRIEDWSGGLNRHCYWRAFGRRPVFNYVNHKFIVPGDEPGRPKRPDLPFKTHRLVFAGALFTDAAICYSLAPRRGTDGLFGVWDELWMGEERRAGWLGAPRGEAVHLAERRPDVLDGAGSPPDKRLAARIEENGLSCEPAGGGLKMAAPGGDKDMHFTIRNIPAAGPDLFVTVTARGRPLSGYPPEMARHMQVGIAPSPFQLVRADLPETGIRLRGRDETPIDGSDPATRASLRYVKAAPVTGAARRAYFVHPPYRGATGQIFWRRELTLPAEARLQLSTGMGPKSPERSDGVVFSVAVAAVTGTETGTYTELLSHRQKSNTWTRHSLDLSHLAGRRVSVKFVADCGPRDNATTDHAYWGDVRIVDADETHRPSKPVRYMTFLGPENFTATFYFSAITSRTVDLSFAVEGAEPMIISRITAHHHPDAMYREYENGVVLANPAPRPFTFDLARLLPGRTYRRIRGTPRQDPETNDGSPVGDSVTLQPKEGLFLVKRP